MHGDNQEPRAFDAPIFNAMALSITNFTDNSPAN
jgi:hypothetical protein